MMCGGRIACPWMRQQLLAWFVLVIGVLLVASGDDSMLTGHAATTEGGDLEGVLSGDVDVDVEGDAVQTTPKETRREALFEEHAMILEGLRVRQEIERAATSSLDTVRLRAVRLRERSEKFKRLRLLLRVIEEEEEAKERWHQLRRRRMHHHELLPDFLRPKDYATWDEHEVPTYTVPGSGKKVDPQTEKIMRLSCIETHAHSRTADEYLLLRQRAKTRPKRLSRARKRREWTLLGPVINNGYDGVLLGVQVMLEIVGLVLSPIRALVWIVTEGIVPTVYNTGSLAFERVDASLATRQAAHDCPFVEIPVHQFDDGRAEFRADNADRKGSSTPQQQSFGCAMLQNARLLTRRDSSLLDVDASWRRFVDYRSYSLLRTARDLAEPVINPLMWVAEVVWDAPFDWIAFVRGSAGVASAAELRAETCVIKKARALVEETMVVSTAEADGLRIQSDEMEERTDRSPVWISLYDSCMEWKQERLEDIVAPPLLQSGDPSATIERFDKKRAGGGSPSSQLPAHQNRFCPFANVSFVKPHELAKTATLPPMTTAFWLGWERDVLQHSSSHYDTQIYIAVDDGSSGTAVVRVLPQCALGHEVKGIGPGTLAEFRSEHSTEDPQLSEVIRGIRGNVRDDTAWWDVQFATPIACNETTLAQSKRRLSEELGIELP